MRDPRTVIADGDCVDSPPTLAVGYGGRPCSTGLRSPSRAASGSACWGRTAAARRRCCASLLGELRAGGGHARGRRRAAAIVPQTERSRLDFPVSALDVALMGALARLPWWRRPGAPSARPRSRRSARSAWRRAAQDTFGELSGGQRQRVLVARALVQDAPRAAARRAVHRPRRGQRASASRRCSTRSRPRAARVLIATHDVEQARALGPRAVPQPPPGRVRRAAPVLDAGGARGDLRRRDRRGRDRPPGRGDPAAHHHEHEP